MAIESNISDFDNSPDCISIGLKVLFVTFSQFGSRSLQEEFYFLERGPLYLESRFWILDSFVVTLMKFDL